MNGMLLHGGNRVYGGTFFVFADYLKAAMRVAAISHLPANLCVYTLTQITVGEDGPTHEPIEQLAAFRATPNLNVIRPAGSNEVSAAWKGSSRNKDRPTVLVFSRQNLPVLEHSQELAYEGVKRGAYGLAHKMRYSRRYF